MPRATARRREVLEEHGTEAASLVVVLHDEGDLGFSQGVLTGPVGRAQRGAGGGLRDARGRPVVASDGHQFPVDDGHECQPVLVVNGYEVSYLLVTYLATGREEAEVHRLSGQSRPESAKRRAVDGPDGTQPSCATVRQQDITLELGGVARRAHRSVVGTRPGRPRGRR